VHLRATLRFLLDTRSAFAPMKIMSVSVAPHNGAGREKCLVTLHVALAGRQESMTMVVVVPDEKDEIATRECGVARAKDFARQFASLS
jgi:hypothetical protein